jgi:uncharacterized SAM-binding protein YcdF (DUF218 family)
MIVPDTNLRAIRRTSALKRPTRPRTSTVAIILLSILIAAVAWVVWVDVQIHAYADHNEAQPADAIAVFGAAEYDGRPSPVLRARLDHGLTLYQEKLAPVMITLGGGDPADAHSEGGVGHDYLLGHGVPERAVIAETESKNTEESARRLAVIARANGLKKILVVSDGTHLFRIHALCSSLGLNVVTSPRPAGKGLSRWDSYKRVAHEILSYSLWRIRHAVGMDN